jgi:hypothetical protein
VVSDQIPRDDPVAAWTRAAVQWQMVGLYLCLFWLEKVKQQLERREP